MRLALLLAAFALAVAVYCDRHDPVAEAARATVRERMLDVIEYHAKIRAEEGTSHGTLDR